MQKDDVMGFGSVALVFFFALFFLIAVIFTLTWGWSKYNVWSSGMEGRAELSKADWSRQILVREAQAKRDSAVMLAQAEVERARGVAQANKIIGDSLKNNDGYLRYLWIQNLQNEKNQVIYVPTETNLPILEANRLNMPKKVTND